MNSDEEGEGAKKMEKYSRNPTTKLLTHPIHINVSYPNVSTLSLAPAHAMTPILSTAPCPMCKHQHNLNRDKIIRYSSIVR